MRRRDCRLFAPLVIALVPQLACGSGPEDRRLPKNTDPAAQTQNSYRPETVVTWDPEHDRKLGSDPDMPKRLRTLDAYICLEHQLGYGPGPAYWICISSDGSVEYESLMGSDHNGRYRWTVSQDRAERLVAKALAPEHWDTQSILHENCIENEDSSFIRIAMKYDGKKHSARHKNRRECALLEVWDLEGTIAQLIQVRPEDQWGLPDRPSYGDRAVKRDQALSEIKKCLSAQALSRLRGASLAVAPSGEVQEARWIGSTPTKSEKACLRRSTESLRFEKSILGDTVILPHSLELQLTRVGDLEH